MPHPSLFVVGPTAVGKSAVALQLAEWMDGEIISADSMQVYRGLDIGTAKPSLADRRRVPHHLVDVVGLTDSFDAACFVQMAHHAARDIQSRGRIPIFCGGTGMYLKAFLEGLGTAPGSDWQLRRELEQIPREELAKELKEKDPETYRRLDLNNRRRLIRAVEVIRISGRPFSGQRTAWSCSGSDPDAGQGPGRARWFGLTRPREELYGRIEERVDAMIEQGLLEETRGLLGHGLRENRTACQAIGYRQVLQFLEGQTDWESTVRSIKQHTRRFAKRQLTWFRHQLPLQWISLDDRTGLEAVATQIKELYLRQE